MKLTLAKIMADHEKRVREAREAVPVLQEQVSALLVLLAAFQVRLEALEAKTDCSGQRGGMMAAHKHDLSPTADGGVYCMSLGCELSLDADETAAAFQAMLEACEAVLACKDTLATGFPRCNICGVLKTARLNHHHRCPVPCIQSAIAQAKGEAKP